MNTLCKTCQLDCDTECPLPTNPLPKPDTDEGYNLKEITKPAPGVSNHKTCGMKIRITVQSIGVTWTLDPISAKDRQVTFLIETLRDDGVAYKTCTLREAETLTIPSPDVVI